MNRFLALLLPLTLMAQDVTFDIGPRDIGKNQALQFKIIIEGQAAGRDISWPNGLEPGDFELLSNRPSTSVNTQIINGNVTAQKSYTYQFRPTKEGTLTFPAQTIQFNGGTYKSKPTIIKVGPERQDPIQRTRDPFDEFFNRRRGFDRDAGRYDQPPEVLVEATVPKNSYYLGEAIPLTISLLRTPGLRINGSNSQMDAPDLKDFWVEELENQGLQRMVDRDDRRLELNVVDQRLLYANKTGKLTIEPITFSLVVTTGVFSGWQKVNRKTEPIEVEIKPLPVEGRPEDFNNLVGDFKLHTSLDKDTIKAGESVSLQIDLAGEGNFSVIQDIPLKGLDPSFEVFEGGSPTTQTMNGRVKEKNWVVALVPKREGTYELPPMELAYFDVNDGTYKVARGDRFTLNVLPGEGLPQQIPAENGQTPFQANDQALNFIKLDALNLDGKPQSLPSPRNLVRLLLAVLLIDLLVFMFLKIKNTLDNRRSGSRPKMALKNFQKTARKLKAQSAKADSKAFFAELSSAIHNYFGDKWERPGQGISLDLIRNEFNRLGLDDSYLDLVTECIEACDLARFTPSTPSSRGQLLEKASETIRRIDEVLS